MLSLPPSLILPYPPTELECKYRGNDLHAMADSLRLSDGLGKVERGGKCCSPAFARGKPARYSPLLPLDIPSILNHATMNKTYYYGRCS